MRKSDFTMSTIEKSKLKTLRCFLFLLSIFKEESGCTTITWFLGKVPVTRDVYFNQCLFCKKYINAFKCFQCFTKFLCQNKSRKMFGLCADRKKLMLWSSKLSSLKAEINIVKQCISDNSTWRFVCCNTYFQNCLAISIVFKCNRNSERFGCDLK